MKQLQTGENPVIFYDGVCGLCNRFVQFVIRHDPLAKFRFTPLQGNYAKLKIGLDLESDPLLQTVYFWYEQKLYTRSRAVIKILQLMGFPWNLAGLFRIIPPWFADQFYNYIAKHRYRWFGRHESCPVPSVELKNRFIEF